MEALIPSAIDGLMLGFVYGLAAMGLTLIFGVMRVINLSHGPVIGVVEYFIALDRVINAPELTTLLATFSVNLMVIGIATSTFTTTPRAVDVSLGSVSAGNVTVLGTHAV